MLISYVQSLLVPYIEYLSRTLCITDSVYIYTDLVTVLNLNTLYKNLSYDSNSIYTQDPVVKDYGLLWKIVSGLWGRSG